ncbi:MULTISPECIES: hypothetical protein [unclassified Pseudomonas]|uniref:hypothetical protein n=1 Tax=unclassified Pseudomonas TaxID=196821 RepID=UPI000FDD521A|nr:MULTISPECIES: hypothetical protein [unclassified Pseudomonas]AZZ76948.1 hypothetical protein CCX46_17955 [Pseudomonas sp. RU47]WNZ82146.1 hypothetical protein QOM10_17780 [Pseudomonas sp. P108]
MRWISIEQAERKKIPEWARSIGITDDGRVFVPAAIGGTEQEVYLCLAYDGTECVQYLKHYFVPVDWMASEFPHTKELCHQMLMTAQRILRESKRT